MERGVAQMEDELSSLKPRTIEFLLGLSIIDVSRSLTHRHH
jgi:hypothetical protein